MVQKKGNSRAYYCCICKKELKDTKPLRLIHQEYGIGRYNQYYDTATYDFCEHCFGIYLKWLKKHEAKSNQELLCSEEI